MYKIYTTGNRGIRIAEESRYMINYYPEMVTITIPFFSYTWNISISYIIIYQISKLDAIMEHTIFKESLSNSSSLLAIGLDGNIFSLNMGQMIGVNIASFFVVQLFKR